MLPNENRLRFGINHSNHSNNLKNIRVKCTWFWKIQKFMKKPKKSPKMTINDKKSEKGLKEKKNTCKYCYIIVKRKPSAFSNQISDCIILNYSSLFLYEQVLLANSAHVCCKNLYHITKDNCQLHYFFFSMDCQVPFQIVFSVKLFITHVTFERLLSFMNWIKVPI